MIALIMYTMGKNRPEGYPSSLHIDDIDPTDKKVSDALIAEVISRGVEPVNIEFGYILQEEESEKIIN